MLDLGLLVTIWLLSLVVIDVCYYYPIHAVLLDRLLISISFHNYIL